MKKTIGIIALIIGILFTVGGLYTIINGYIIGLTFDSFEYILGTVLGVGFWFILGILLIRYGFKKIYEKTPKP